MKKATQNDEWLSLCAQTFQNASDLILKSFTINYIKFYLLRSGVVLASYAYILFR